FCTTSFVTRASNTSQVVIITRFSTRLFTFSYFFFFSSRRRHTRWPRDWSSDVCSSDLETRPICEPAGRVSVPLAGARPRRGERGRRDGGAILVLRRASRGAPRRAPLVCGRDGAPPRHAHRAKRLVVHGLDPAGRADRQERDHPARFHAAPDANRAPIARGRDPGGRACAPPPDSDDDAVHPVRPAPTRPRHRGGERAATTARP